MPTRPETRAVSARASRLADAGRRFYSRGWVLGTSGNFSAVLTAQPLVLLITPSGAHKGTLTGRVLLRVDAECRVLGRRSGRPSAETALHLEIVRASGAGAVLHTHSVWGTMLSDAHAPDGGITLEGYEMLKGLDGVTTHEHREWVPIVDNDQDIGRLAARVRPLLERQPSIHAVLIRAHGLYTWGRTIEDAERHVEILEFLFETVGRRRQYGHRHDSGAGREDRTA